MITSADRTEVNLPTNSSLGGPTCTDQSNIYHSLIIITLEVLNILLNERANVCLEKLKNIGVWIILFLFEKNPTS